MNEGKSEGVGHVPQPEKLDDEGEGNKSCNVDDKLCVSGNNNDGNIPDKSHSTKSVQIFSERKRAIRDRVNFPLNPDSSPSKSIHETCTNLLNLYQLRHNPSTTQSVLDILRGLNQRSDITFEDLY